MEKQNDNTVMKICFLLEIYKKFANTFGAVSRTKKMNETNDFVKIILN